jgi:hypothetical protein
MSMPRPEHDNSSACSSSDQRPHHQRGWEEPTTEKRATEQGAQELRNRLIGRHDEYIPLS